MERVLKQKVVIWPWAAALAAVVAFGALLPQDLDTKLMAMTGAWLGLVLLQHMLGTMRRYSGLSLVHYGAIAAYYLQSPLVVYMANTVRSSSSDTVRLHHISLFALLPAMSFYSLMYGLPSVDTPPFNILSLLKALYWCFCLVSLDIKLLLAEENRLLNSPIHTATTVSIACIGIFAAVVFYIVCKLLLQTYLGQHVYTIPKTAAPLSWLVWSSVMKAGNSGKAGEPTFLIYLYLFMGIFHIGVITILVYLPYKWSIVVSTREHKAKACADCMEEEINSLSPFFIGAGDDSYSLDRCKYPIMLEGEGRGPIERVNEACSKIYIRQPITPEESGPEERVLPDVFLSYSFFQLLARRYFGFRCAEEGNPRVRHFALRELMQPDYRRAFAIVEAQLAFLHDEFFFTDRWALLYPFPCLLGPMLILSTTYMNILWRGSSSSPPGDTLFYSSLLLLPGILLSLREAKLVFATDWYRIGNAIRTHFVSTSDPLQPIRQRYYWKHELGQYSVIKDYDRFSVKSMAKHYPVIEDAVGLPDSVRKMVARTLQETNGPPTNGARVRADLSWACRQETHTHSILVWHIATFYCDVPQHDLSSEEIRTHYEVATALSRYCAYLVAFLPEFLPEQKETTERVFQDVVRQAKTQLSRDQDKSMSMAEKQTKIRELTLPEQETSLTTFAKGVKLGRQLEGMDTSLRWEQMAEFWAETILYIAPSHNVALHFNHLAKGGEFVTHLWAMLSNAGILKRASE